MLLLAVVERMGSILADKSK